MKQTALEELIDYIEEFTTKNKTTDGIWAKAKSLLPKEKQQIIGARVSAPLLNTGNKDRYEIEAEQYYNETYKK
jgi:hypothetical protein